MIAAHIVTFGLIDQLETEARINEWRDTFSFSIMQEMLVWDFALMPAIVLGTMSCCKCARNLFSKHISI